MKKPHPEDPQIPENHPGRGHAYGRFKPHKRDKDFTPEPVRVQHDDTSTLDLPTPFRRPDKIEDPLYVITTVFNSPRFRSRWKLYEDFARYVDLNPAAELYTAEIAFGDREFAVTQPDNPRHLQLRTTDELWLKERALNLLVQRLPPDWKYVAWIDADIHFARYDWADEARHALQHTPVIQMWGHGIDLSSEFEPVQEHRSFVYSRDAGAPPAPPGYYGGKGQIIWWHPGYAWAMRRETWDGLGGLLDVSILGAADSHMAHAFVGRAEETMPVGLSEGYKAQILAWQERAERVVKRNLGMMNGLVLHYWHGPKRSRRYATRGQILVETGFDPALDLVQDWQGLWRLSGRSIELRDRVRAYFRSRDEDVPTI